MNEIMILVPLAKTYTQIIHFVETYKLNKQYFVKDILIWIHHEMQ